jgi:hypothetical protein
LEGKCTDADAEVNFRGPGSRCDRLRCAHWGRSLSRESR